MDLPEVVSPEEFRTALGAYATGVTVVTAVGSGGPSGATANAVTSLRASSFGTRPVNHPELLRTIRRLPRGRSAAGLETRGTDRVILAARPWAVAGARALRSNDSRVGWHRFGPRRRMVTSVNQSGTWASRSAAGAG